MAITFLSMRENESVRRQISTYIHRPYRYIQQLPVVPFIDTGRLFISKSESFKASALELRAVETTALSFTAKYVDYRLKFKVLR